MSGPDLDVGPVLDETLADLLNLGLLAKHVRWNVVGPGFLGLHALLDDVATLALGAGDRIAVRSMALGRHPDGRAGTVAMKNSLPTPDLGPVRDADATVLLGTAFETITTRLFTGLAVAQCDPVTQDLLTGVAADLERCAWMIRAQGR